MSTMLINNCLRKWGIVRDAGIIVWKLRCTNLHLLLSGLMASLCVHTFLNRICTRFTKPKSKLSPTRKDIGHLLSSNGDITVPGRRILILPCGSWRMTARRLQACACANIGSALALFILSLFVHPGGERVWAWRYYSIALPNFIGVIRA